MRVKKIVDEDFTNYKNACMFICTCSCSGKCCIEQNLPISICQNDGWRKVAPVKINNCEIIERYLDNSITSAICFGGLEPFEQFDELIEFIKMLRMDYCCKDEVVIYTGFNEMEILSQINKLKQFENIIIKFGRFIPNATSVFDRTLGVTLISDNQYAKKIS